MLTASARPLQVAWLLAAGLAWAADEPQKGATMPGTLVETDPESGAQVFLLGADPRPADNIYGEQPYGDASGRRIAIRYYAQGEQRGGISIVDLVDGSRHEVLSGKPPFPAFHAWGEWLYYQQTVDGQRLLRRCHYLTMKIESVAVLPPERGSYSYGTVSPDHRWFAVSVSNPDTPAKVHLLDLARGAWKLLLDKPGYHAKHEQFSRDGRNKVLIQLNQMPDIKQVLLGEVDVDGTLRLFPADQPHTPRPTGHEAWIGDTGSIFYSTAADPAGRGAIWTCRVDDPAPKPIHLGARRFGHVSVSRCGRYWIGDNGEEGVPLYVGSFASGRCQRLILSRTVHDGQQWSHTHPYFTADNRWLIFTSTRGGHPQVYGAKLAEGWLASLD
ncbi:MAG: PD40 domain-containing protein, partial [Armatimonadetes bacterium]|nr:PD40 domain-containing protein [Armatimonadota bacterium]